MSWDAEWFAWTHDQHALAMAEAFGFDGKKQLEKTRHVTAAPGSQPVGRDCATVPVCGRKERSRNTTPQLGRLCMWDMTDQRRSTPRKRRQDSCLDRHALPDACSNDGACTTVRYLWTFPLRSMPTELRAVTDANWAGELEAFRSTSSRWMYFSGNLLESYSSTQHCGTVECGAKHLTHV